MNPATAETPLPKTPLPKWTTTRWLALIALIFVLHVALIFLFGTESKVIPLIPKNMPQLRLADDSSELLALNDPTLFALPHMDHFASTANLKMPEIKQPSFHWTEAPRWLSPPIEKFGATFQGFMRTNQFAAYQLNFKPQPKLAEPYITVEPAFAQNSMLQIQGDLARRKLLATPALPSLPYDDVLKPSKVQVLVDKTGNVVSIALLESSGWDDADRRALDFARAAHFSPSMRLTVGQLIFNWRTIPPFSTNAPANPQ